MFDFNDEINKINYLRSSWLAATPPTTTTAVGRAFCSSERVAYSSLSK